MHHACTKKLLYGQVTKFSLFSVILIKKNSLLDFFFADVGDARFCFLHFEGCICSIFFSDLRHPPSKIKWSVPYCT